jgi:nucleoid-associated protein YgaU
MNFQRMKLFICFSFLCAFFLLGGCASADLELRSRNDQDSWYNDQDDEDVPKPARVVDPLEAPHNEVIPQQVQEESKEPAPEPIAAPEPAPVETISEVTESRAVQAKVAPAEAAPAPNLEMKEHTVWLWQESKDCLWNLAAKYYGDPWLWKKIYLANQDEIEDPAVIYPRQVLKIPPLDENEKE